MEDKEYFVRMYHNHKVTSLRHFFTVKELLEWMDSHDRPPQKCGSGEGYTVHEATCIIDWS